MDFPNECSEFIYTRTYARWIDEEKRRETWAETVERYIKFIHLEVDHIPDKTIRKIRQYLMSFDVMPSMRLLWAAGGAAYKDNTCIYNCAYCNIDSVESFAECLYILMSGCGFGFGVSQKHVDKLPVVAENTGNSLNEYIIPDSKEGWSDSLKMLMDALYRGMDIPFNYTKIRAEGERLSIMGGRASGPAPLIRVHQFIREVFNQAQRRKLTTLECHDICNQIAECVVSGGVRRSSQISLSDLDDELMRDAKIWPFPLRRAMSNNSAYYHERPPAAEFLREWAQIASSGTGERGIFNIGDAIKTAPKRRTAHLIEGTNPCGEIMLRDKQFCNLSEVVVKPDDDLDRLLDKVETAAWMGVIQSTFTNFPYLRKKWETNCTVERLLGVSLTGQLDNWDVLDATALKALKSRALRIAKHAAKVLEVQEPKAVTCVKPSGTVSQLVNSASGIHPRYSRYYLRRYRISSSDPLYHMMKKQGVNFHPEVGQSSDDATTFVCEFPVMSPQDSLTRNEFNAISQLEWYKTVQRNWCEHNASMTVYVKDNEWFEVGNWVYKNWSIVNGLSFLPFNGGKYRLAPYEEIDEQRYRNLKSNMKEIDYSKLSDFEIEDNTTGSKELACSGDNCDI